MTETGHVFLTYPDRDMLAIEVAKTLVDDLCDALDRQDRVRFAVPGGTTPGPVFDVLSSAALDWSRVDVLLTDERWVPPTHPRSNAALIRARLLSGRAAEARLTPFFEYGTTAEAAAQGLSERIDPMLPLDVVLLGMGTDMHTASLFPDAAGLSTALSAQAPSVVALAPDGDLEPRLSLSAKVLCAAEKRHLLITGDEKRAALARATETDPNRAPVRVVLPGTLVHWSP